MLRRLRYWWWKKRNRDFIRDWGWRTGAFPPKDDSNQESKP